MNSEIRSYITEVLKEERVQGRELFKYLRGKKRVSDARHIIAYNLVHRFNLTYVEAGKILGRHHRS